PVVASSAMMRASGVMKYIMPSDTIGVASNERWLPLRIVSSPVWYVHATARRRTDAVSTCFSGEKRVPCGSCPYEDQSPEALCAEAMAAGSNAVRHARIARRKGGMPGLTN